MVLLHDCPKLAGALLQFGLSRDECRPFFLRKVGRRPKCLIDPMKRGLDVASLVRWGLMFFAVRPVCEFAASQCFLSAV